MCRSNRYLATLDVGYESSYLGYDATPRETADMRPLFARALHICPHVICYRGCMLHLLGTSSCVESFVISFLGRQFICFFLVSLHAKALVIMLSSLRVAQKPEHFFSHMICIAWLLHIYIMHALHTQVPSDISNSFESCKTPSTWE